MTFLGVVDRFEGDLAVIRCQGQQLTIPISLLPPKIKEGSVLGIKIRHLEGEENRRRKAAADLFDSL